MGDPAFRFSFGEVVRVVGLTPELAPIHGERGVVCGRTDDPAEPAYGVFIYRDEEVWHVEEPSLEATGAFDHAEEAAYALRVRVDEEGRGHLAGVRER